MLKRTGYLFGLILLSAGGGVLADTSEQIQSERSAPEALSDLPPLFADVEPLEITLRAAWSRIARDRQKEPEDYPAQLILTDNTGAATTLSLKVRPRGKSRRLKTNCDFPPLQLNFQRKAPELANTVFAMQDKLKLVTHCANLGNRRATYADRLHSEYLLYQIYNLVTPKSFQVRRLKINYAEASSEPARQGTEPVGTDIGRTYLHPAFVIEHKKAVATRTGHAVTNRSIMTPGALDSLQANLGALFAYFAGNTDFSFTRGPDPKRCCHNAIMLNEAERFYPVPYDFDATGFVDPPYALPADGLRLQTVTQRRYRGFCAHRQQVNAGVERFMAIKASIYDLLNSYPDISERRRKKLLRYTKEFYATLENPKQLERRITSQCR